MKHIREGAHTIDNNQSTKIFKIDKTIKICLDNITTHRQIYSLEQMDFNLLLGIDWCIATKATFGILKRKLTHRTEQLIPLNLTSSNKRTLWTQYCPATLN
jgi:hypothetical protein